MALSSAPADLIITDLGMPSGVNGRKLADAARGHRRDLNVLVNTEYTAPPVLDSANPSAGMHVMTKPLALDAFVERIGDLPPDDDRDRSY